MELKNYQQTAIGDLTRFLSLLEEKGRIPEAYNSFWEEKKVPVGFGGLPPYQNIIPGVLNICFKVPTGGGKTFLAAAAIKPIFDNLPHTKTKAVVWLVPSDSILEQTFRTLSDARHPYRGRINTDFSHRVEVYSKAQLLSGANFNYASMHENLSVFVLSYDSFRTSKKEGRKAYQENGSLAELSQHFNDPAALLADTDETALIQIIRALNPVVIVDESHHAATPLSKEMLTNFNPSFVLDLTATPRKESNIISYVDALNLKKESMVKLPVIVYNRRSQDDVYIDAINVRDKLEKQAKKECLQTGRYIRPIVLFQAEPKGNDTTTFDKVKQNRLEMGIPENQLAIKTADKNELRGVNLLSEKCPIRYIITVNALKEGWDCPFAYILATIANRKSVVDVEQILGRVLRLPYAARNKHDILNICYVITSSSDFHAALKRVITGLNSAGFSDKDYRIGVTEETSDASQISEHTQTPILPVGPDNTDDDIVDTETIKDTLQKRQEEDIDDISQDAMLRQAVNQAEQYETAVKESGNKDFDSAPAEVREHMNVYRMNDKFTDEASKLILPQFVIPNNTSIFDDSAMTLLDKEALTEGFILANQDTIIDFSSVEGEIIQVDIDEEDSGIPKTRRLSAAQNYFFHEWFKTQPPEKQINACKQVILKQLSKINAVSDKDLAKYVARIIEALNSSQLEDLQQSPLSYSAKIKKKIDELIDTHREKTFNRWILEGKITTEPRYNLKSTISPLKVNQTFDKTLYEAEEEMNGLEQDVAWELANLPNIKWWHRNLSRTGFSINGYVNAYPDIIAMTVSGKILILEPKGDHLENAESRRKADIGSEWQRLSGGKYRYFMVFRDKNLNVRGAVRFNEFKKIVQEL